MFHSLEQQHHAYCKLRTSVDRQYLEQIWHTGNKSNMPNIIGRCSLYKFCVCLYSSFVSFCLKLLQEICIQMSSQCLVWCTGYRPLRFTTPIVTSVHKETQCILTHLYLAQRSSLSCYLHELYPLIKIIVISVFNIWRWLGHWPVVYIYCRKMSNDML